MEGYFLDNQRKNAGTPISRSLIYIAVIEKLILLAAIEKTTTMTLQYVPVLVYSIGLHECFKKQKGVNAKEEATMLHTTYTQLNLNDPPCTTYI